MLPLVAVLAVIGIWWFSRQSDLFCISARNGKALVLRGRVPPGLLADVRAVVARTPSRSATIRAVKDARGGRLRFSGNLGEDQEQRLRNVFSLYPMAQLTHAPLIARPTLGQLLGVAWLAWILDRRA